MLRSRNSGNWLGSRLGLPQRATDLKIYDPEGEAISEESVSNQEDGKVDEIRHVSFAGSKNKENYQRNSHKVETLQQSHRTPVSRYPGSHKKPPPAPTSAVKHCVHNSTHPESLTTRAVSIPAGTHNSTHPESLTPIPAAVEKHNRSSTHPESIPAAAEKCHIHNSTHPESLISVPVASERHNRTSTQSETPTNYKADPEPSQVIPSKIEPTPNGAHINCHSAHISLPITCPSLQNQQTNTNHHSLVPSHHVTKADQQVNYLHHTNGGNQSVEHKFAQRLSVQHRTSVTENREEQDCPAPQKEMFSLADQGMETVVMRSSDYKRRFKKLKLLGTGGSSKVFKVLGEDFQIYALKEVYMKSLDESIKKAYINEIKLLKRLRDKPEIITLHDFTWDKEEHILYLLLDYAEMDLNVVIVRGGKQNVVNPMASTIYFWNQMLQVVKVIHDENIIHNDLKPENFVCIGLRLQLIDFGISSKIEVDHTSIERDNRCGTINYMAPETIEYHEDKEYYKVGKPSDVWSLGCILYQMVYGRTPFEHIKHKLKKWHAIIDSAVSIPFPDIPNKNALDIMKKCLNRDPKKRPKVEELLSHPFSTGCSDH